MRTHKGVSAGWRDAQSSGSRRSRSAGLRVSPRVPEQGGSVELGKEGRGRDEWAAQRRAHVHLAHGHAGVGL